MNSPARILVTRSGAEGQALAGRLRAAGLAALHYAPVVLRGPADPDAIRRHLLALLPADCLVVPSAEALRRLVTLVDPGRLAGMPVVVPGRGTARVATALGLGNVLAPNDQGTSERILDLPALQAVDGRRVLILGASGGRRLIEQTLRERGAQVHRVHVYRRLPARPSADLLATLAAGDDLVALLASGGALEGLQRHFSTAAWRTLTSGLVIAPSRRVADLARAAGCRQVVGAAGADDHSMLTALALARPELLPMSYSVE
ncbi:MAG: uroporphyrinogen-III synthase [Wenzhouxiangella sp.]|nr:MAG: uroporphyrinogen-III synthase [Wenzhouxiangella sp.]